MSRCGRLTTLIVLLLVTLVTSGCRDLRTGGRTLAEEDVLRGRPAGRGGPELLVSELAQGWVALEAGDESALRNALANRLQLSIDLDIDVTDALPGTLAFFANGDVTTYDRVARSFDTQPRTLAASFGSLSVQDLLDQIEGTCANALFSAALGPGACAGFNFDLGFSPNPIDGITFEIDRSSIVVQWLAPESVYNARPFRRDSGNNPSGDDCVDNNGCSGGTSCVSGTCSCDGMSTTCGFAFSCNTTTSLCEYDDVTCTSDAECVDRRPDIGLDEANCSGAGLCEKRVQWRFDSDASMDHPVLAIDVTFEVTDIDEDEAVALTVFPVQVENWRTRFRLQPIPCTDAACTNVPAIFDEFASASPAGDLIRNNFGLRWTLKGEHLSHSVRIDEAGGFVFWLTFGIGSAAAEDLARDGFQRGFIGLSRALGNMGGLLLNLPVSVRRVNQDFGEGLVLGQLSGMSTTWASAVAPFTSFDLAAFSFHPDSSRVITTVDGELTNAFVEALASGSGIEWVGFDARFLRQLCGPDPRVTIGGTCGTNPAAPGCAAICTPCSGTAAPACDFTGDNFALEVAGNALVTAVFPLPTAPDLATIFEGILISGTTARGWLGNVLESLEPTLARFTDIAWCPLGTHSARCPDSFSATADRVVLHFHPDGDGDGIPDAFDLCPGDPAVSDDPDADWDGDGHGNACDLCPLNIGPNTDRDGDGIGDACDCDLDNDDCNQETVGVAVDPPDGVTEEPVRFCTLSGDVFDQRPNHSDSGRDADGDLVSDDCDADDDNDGILDDGAGDGIGTYTACGDGETLTCDDNCRFDANSGQEDRNENDLGDACDPICNASTPAWRCDPGTWERPGAVGIGDGAPGGLDPNCPACLLELRCTDIPGLPGPFGGCPGRGRSIGFGPGAFLDVKAVLGNLPYSRLAAAFLLPDFDNDGFSDLGLALEGSVQDKLAVQVLAFGSSNAGILWQIELPEGAIEVGGVAVDGNSIFVGSPDFGQDAGAVFELSAADGSPLHTFTSFTAGRFGASVHVAGGQLFVGAPFDANGAGRLLIMDRCVGQPLDVIDGPGQGFFLGTGPISFIRRGAGDFIAIGAPDANGGDGAFLLLRQNPLEVALLEKGMPGARLGASLAALEGISSDGSSQAWVGAPGFAQGQGAVYQLSGALEFGRILGMGSEPGEFFGAQIQHGGTSLYVGLPGAVFGIDGPGAWAEFDLGDHAFAVPPVGGFDLPIECPAPPVCGDGLVGTPETCDDGNQVTGDGCYASCQLENATRIEGTAQGGSLLIEVSGDSLLIATFAGQTKSQVAAAIVDAINASSRLTALGISAVSFAGRVVTDGMIDGISTDDPGLSFLADVPTILLAGWLVLITAIALLGALLVRRADAAGAI